MVKFEDLDLKTKYYYFIANNLYNNLELKNVKGKNIDDFKFIISFLVSFFEIKRGYIDDKGLDNLVESIHRIVSDAPELLDDNLLKILHSAGSENIFHEVDEECYDKITLRLLNMGIVETVIDDFNKDFLNNGLVFYREILNQYSNIINNNLKYDNLDDIRFEDLNIYTKEFIKIYINLVSQYGELRYNQLTWLIAYKIFIQNYPNNKLNYKISFSEIEKNDDLKRFPFYNNLEFDNLTDEQYNEKFKQIKLEIEQLPKIYQNYFLIMCNDFHALGNLFILYLDCKYEVLFIANDNHLKEFCEFDYNKLDKKTKKYFREVINIYVYINEELKRQINNLDFLNILILAFYIVDKTIIDSYNNKFEDLLSCSINLSPMDIMKKLNICCANLIDMKKLNNNSLDYYFKEIIIKKIKNNSQFYPVMLQYFKNYFYANDFLYFVFNFYFSIEEPKKEMNIKGKKEFEDYLNMKKIQEKYIGQENAVQELFLNMNYNQRFNCNRSVIFLDGPTGTGKTAITKDIAKLMKVPILYTSITSYSVTGYHGNQIEEILVELYYKSRENLELAEKGIVILDEFDKIISNGSEGLKIKQSLQQSLLNFIGGSKYYIEVEKKDNIYIKEKVRVEFDTSKLTFICMGALTNLRNNKTNIIGFQTNSEKMNQQQLGMEDLIKAGFEKELIARFNVFISTKTYNRDDLKNILLYSSNTPLNSLKNCFNSAGKELILEDEQEIYDYIVDIAYNLNVGARGLETTIDTLRTKLLKSLFFNDSSEIYLSLEDVKKMLNRFDKGKIK